MPLGTRKFRGQEFANEHGRQFLANDAGAECKDVHVIVFYALTRRKRIMTHARTDAVHLRGGNRRADAAPTHQDAAIRSAGRHGPRHRLGAVGVVITRHQLRRPTVLRLKTQRGDLGDDAPPQWPSRMIGCKGDSPWVTPGPVGTALSQDKAREVCEKRLGRGCARKVGVTSPGARSVTTITLQT
jgi:hypothetical protein